MDEPDAAPDVVEQIAASLDALRPAPRPPREHGPHEHGPHEHGPHHGHGPAFGDPDAVGRRGRGGAGPFGHDGPGPFGHGGGPGPFGGRGGRGDRFAASARMRLLDALASASTPLGVSALAERIGVDQPRASRLVQQCVDLDLARRIADPDDARRTLIELTAQGAELIAEHRRARTDRIRAALEGLSPDEQAEFARLFARFAANWRR